MDPLALRVAARYMHMAGWNATNGKYVSVSWNVAKWVVEEMANGDPIPATSSFTEAGPAKHVYEMTTLKSMASKSALYRLFPGVETIRAGTHMHGDDKGPVVRQKIIDAYKKHFHAVTVSLKEEDSLGELPAWEKLVPELERKLVWKKVR
jgi:hypothetical protein